MSTAPRVLAFSGSARKGSYNKLLVQVAATGARNAGADVTFIDLADYDLPVYNADLEQLEGLPENVKKFKELLNSHDALLISSPENNSTFSALLKNTIDWASRPMGNEPGLIGFQGKVAGVMAASPGPMGGIRGLPTLRLLLESIGVMVITAQRAVGGAASAFNENGTLVDKKMQTAIEGIGATLAETAAKLNA